MTKIVLTLRKAEPTVQTRQTDKKSPEKAGFAFFGDFVLAEGLGGGARQREKRKRPFKSAEQCSFSRHKRKGERNGR
ncbi:hypothetical protein RFW18_16895 [Metabacillus idriensis]|uniref:hypothetical protein n=1 Tax=Metabacillus idriensis TaxID=324768 RepID=UPI0028144AE2|nr:hypothetical protein [Metabacillus idriensis]MDR0139434.1 hypothetical protein [Metabacillus idriensis]